MEKSRVRLNQSNIRVLKSSHICLIVFELFVLFFVFCMRAPCLHSLAYILLLTGNLLGDLNKSGSLRAHLLVSFYLFCFVSPLTRRIYFVIIYLYVIHSRREDSLTRKTKPDFYVGITKNSVDCLNAGNLL